MESRFVSYPTLGGNIYLNMNHIVSAETHPGGLTIMDTSGKEHQLSNRSGSAYNLSSIIEKIELELESRLI